MVAYGLVTIVVNALIGLEIIDVPASRRDLLVGQLAVYAPWFLVGGILFGLTAMAFGRSAGRER
jgi:hypothetical protein